MALKTARAMMPALMMLLIAALACSLPTGKPTQMPIEATIQVIEVIPPTAGSEATVTPTLSSTTASAPITHVMQPAETVLPGLLVHDVVSKDTAAEQRAPYGDSYDINRLERPFLQDMTYVPDLDIESYMVSEDSNWWYVSIDLVGMDPNNAMNIHYGVELDKDHDGFGDYIVWASPPYTTTWDTLPVKIYVDQNHNSAGLTGSKSDAPITTDGYESLYFDGSAGGADPDIAWVRMNASSQAVMQLAFKKSWSGTVFMLGVVADGGMKDVGKFDLVDRFKEVEAGSPVRDKQYYPLKALHSVDNVCREAFGFKPTGEEPQLCPREEVSPQSNTTPQVVCTNPGGKKTQAACQAAGCNWYSNPTTPGGGRCTFP